MKLSYAFDLFIEVQADTREEAHILIEKIAEDVRATLRASAATSQDVCFSDIVENEFDAAG